MNSFEPQLASTSSLAARSVHVLTVGGAPFVERTRSGSRAFAGTDLSVACRLLAGVDTADPTARVERMETIALVALLAATDVAELHLATTEGVERYAVDEPTRAFDACPLVMVVDVGDRPGRDSESGREVFRLRRERVVLGEISPLALDSWLAFDQDVYVPCHAEMIAREMWPRFTVSQGPTGEQLAAFEFFTTIESAARRAGSGGRVMAMGGRDALRWAYAAPITLDSIVIDPGEPMQTRLGRRRVLSILFQAVLPFEDPGSLPAMELADMTAFMPIDPELSLVSGTLVRNWRSLIGPSGPAPSGQYPCGFTTQNAFIAALDSRTFSLENAVAPSECPPFRKWLALARECGAVILDPASPAPLELDVTQLFLLAQWAECLHSIQPEEFVTDLAREFRRGHLSEMAAAAIAAQWPTWVVGEIEGRDGSESRPWIATQAGRTRALLQRAASVAPRRGRALEGTPARGLAQSHDHELRRQKPVRGRAPRVHGSRARSGSHGLRAQGSGTRANARRALHSALAAPLAPASPRCLTLPTAPATRRGSRG